MSVHVAAWLLSNKSKMKKPNRYLQGPSENPDGQEARIADRFGGKKVAGSGSSKYSKGDVRDVEWSPVDDLDRIEFLVECKQTIHASLSVKWEWLRKISREANAVGGEPALAIEIKGGVDDPMVDRDWVMVPARVFEKLKRT